MLQAPSVFISKCNSKRAFQGGPASANEGEQLHWELAQNQGWHMKGISPPEP